MTQVNRLWAAWRALPRDQRLAGTAALVLLATMLLPWYTASRPVAIRGRGAQLVHDNQSAIQAFSWVEAAVFLVSLGVLFLLLARGERRAFHLPGGDGTVIAAAGGWATLLIVWRLFDKPSLGQGVVVGLAWGIFVSFVAAALLAAAGNRVRRAHRPEPPLDRADRPSPAPGEAVPVRIPEDRPHLAETRVLGDRSPLSREAAARDTADFGVVPASDEAPTERVSAPDEAPTKPVSAGEKDAGEEGEGPGREGEQPRLPGI
ncbi:MAG: hypothetical protein QOJ97_2076 [Solirubrobacteraceae bacterium]|jgi:hypothetical protein|nr:hypothetical protein [Solirubrobacteraceae bacterium]